MTPEVGVASARAILTVVVKLAIAMVKFDVETLTGRESVIVTLKT